MKYFQILIVLFLYSCDPPEDLETPTKETFCDCKELHYNSDYNVFHQGNPRNPYTGICKDFYKGGILKKEINLKNGKYHGVYKFYFKSGTLKSSIDYEIGLVTGHQKLYDQSGKLIYDGIYKRNKLIKNIYHNSSQDTIPK